MPPTFWRWDALRKRPRFADCFRKTRQCENFPSDKISACARRVPRVHFHLPASSTRFGRSRQFLPLTDESMRPKSKHINSSEEKTNWEIIQHPRRQLFL